MKILAFLQNTWARDAARTQALFDRWEKQGQRHTIVAKLLFMGSKTGRRLRRWLGEDLVDKIIWEEASPVVTSTSDGCPPADLAHMTRVLQLHKPTHVMTIGAVATAAWDKLPPDETGSMERHATMHPCARGEQAYADFVRFSNYVRERMEIEEAHEAFSR